MSAAEGLPQELDAVVGEARARLAAAATTGDLRVWETDVLGKRGPLARLHRQLGSLAPEERRQAGQELHQARQELEGELSGRREALAAAERAGQFAEERLDLTELVRLAPGGSTERGHLHLVTQTRDELEDVFLGMGYVVAEGPEVETDWYNFEALNFPPGHPARSMQDTFFVRWGEPESTLLRTHTSPVQVRVMEAQPPPIYTVMPGRCHRRDTADARHIPGFNQIEGLAVDEGLTFGDLAGTIETFTIAYFGPDIQSRLRPAFFPFTEPSAEFEVTCAICRGTGCRTCSGTGWIELGGCGMVHPNVLSGVGIDPERWTGFAFGFGIDRCAQVRHEIEDMRVFQDNDLRFLTQF